MFILGGHWRGKRKCQKCFELLCRLRDCGYRGNAKANTGMSIYSVVKEAHVVLIRKIFRFIYKCDQKHSTVCERGDINISDL